jgi:hypothetical protein
MQPVAEKPSGSLGSFETINQEERLGGCQYWVAAQSGEV